MRVIDMLGNELQEVDSSVGYCVPDKHFIRHHEAVEGVQEKGHYQTVAEYPNGGKDVEWVVDVPGVEAAEAWDEYEDILRFVPYTAEELVVRRIGELKQKLRDTDYNILKVVEGATTLEACGAVIRERAQWRKEINELESQLNIES